MSCASSYAVVLCRSASLQTRACMLDTDAHGASHGLTTSASLTSAQNTTAAIDTCNLVCCYVIRTDKGWRVHRASDNTRHAQSYIPSTVSKCAEELLAITEITDHRHLVLRHKRKREQSSYDPAAPPLRPRKQCTTPVRAAPHPQRRTFAAEPRYSEDRLNWQRPAATTHQSESVSLESASPNANSPFCNAGMGASPTAAAFARS